MRSGNGCNSRKSRKVDDFVFTLTGTLTYESRSASFTIEVRVVIQLLLTSSSGRFLDCVDSGSCSIELQGKATSLSRKAPEKTASKCLHFVLRRSEYVGVCPSPSLTIVSTGMDEASRRDLIMSAKRKFGCGRKSARAEDRNSSISAFKIRCFRSWFHVSLSSCDSRAHQLYQCLEARMVPKGT